MTRVLEVCHLAVQVPSGDEYRVIITDVTLHVAKSEALGLVGESGSGKSMTARTLLRLLPRRTRVTGSVVIDGHNVLEMNPAQLRQLRADDVAMIFQDPRAHTNPVRTTGDFLTEALRRNRHVAVREAEQTALRLLDEVGIQAPDRCMRQYPHELSGGMLQRVMIAAALAVEPKLLIADEPTTALDVTTQSDLMALLSELRRSHNLAMLFITHDLELAAATCERISVMYAGRIVESQSSAQLLARPLHPYTIQFTKARPMINARVSRLAVIDGSPAPAFEVPVGCPFAPRCPHALEACMTWTPRLEPFLDGFVACLRCGELSGVPSSSRETL